MYQNSGLPEGKQVVSINHIIVQTVQTHWAPLISERIVGSLPKSKPPRSIASQGSALQAGCGLRPVVVTSFCTWIRHSLCSHFLLMGSWVLGKNDVSSSGKLEPLSSLLLSVCLVSGALIKLGRGPSLWSAQMLLSEVWHMSFKDGVSQFLCSVWRLWCTMMCSRAD